jgi:hypothetical protein
MNNKSITDFIKPTIITAQQYGTKVSVEIDHSDTNLDELMDAFQTLIVGLGYSDTSLKSWVLDRADEYRETDTEDLKKALNDWKFEEDESFELTHRYNEDSIDAAIAEHNAHEEGFSIDGGFDGNPIKVDTGTTYFTVPVNFYTDDLGNKVYDYEGMADQFEEQLSQLDESAVVMVSVETNPIFKPNETLKEAAKKYKKKVKTK